MLTCSATEIQQIIDSAVARGEREVVLPAGMHPLDQVLRLKGLKDFTIRGDDTTLVFTNLRNCGILATDCDGLTLESMTLDSNPLGFTQGTIETLDRESGLLTFKVHEGYPDLEPYYLSGRAFAFSPETLNWKKDTPVMYAQKAEAINPREGRLQFSRGKMATLKTLNVGDYIVLDFRNSRGIRIERGRNITMKDVTMWSLPSIGVISRFMDGDNYFSYTIERGPMPEGAQVPRLLSISADGFNYAYARKGPIIEGCDFSFMGDDSVNLHGIAFYVAQIKDDMLYLIRPYLGESFTSIVNTGDVAMSIAPDTFDVKDRAIIQSFELEQNASEDFLKIAETIWQSKAVKSGRISVYAMQVDKHAMSVEAGDFIEIPAISAPNYTIRNNHFHDHRGRGLRLMSSNGLVEGNIFENIKQSAISIGSEMTFYREAGWVENVTILNNIIKDVGFDPVMHLSGTHVPGAISLYHRGATPETARPNMHIRDINIMRNTIEEIGGPAIHINQAEDVYVVGNTISGSNQLSKNGTGSDYGLDTTQPISIDFSKDIHICPSPSVTE
jgi:hypothetical protein